MWLCVWQFSSCGPVVSIMQTRKCFLEEELHYCSTIYSGSVSVLHT